ncbi:hypothetical protein K2X33_14520 [bacterium]|nr:hypothetical protein [bacterium]
MRSDFLSHATSALAALLNEALGEEAFSLFRKMPRVVVGTPYTPNSTDLHLRFAGHEVVHREGGTFRCEDPEGGVLVFRNPDALRLHYQLWVSPSQGLALAAWDRLLAYFFDHAAVDPFIPESLKAVPGLYQRLLQDRAKLSVEHSSAGNTDPNEPLFLKIQYSALYHSGAVLNREALVKQRVFDYRNTERSIP